MSGEERAALARDVLEKQNEAVRSLMRGKDPLASAPLETMCIEHLRKLVSVAGRADRPEDNP